MTRSRSLHPSLAEIENALFAPQAAVVTDAEMPMPVPDDSPAVTDAEMPPWLAELIHRRVSASAAFADRALPSTGQIVQVFRARDADGQPLELARPFAVLLNEPAEHGLWYGWCCAPDLDWATAFDLLLEPDDEPFDPLAGMVQLWNPVYVQPGDCDRVLAVLAPERLAAVRALAVDFVTGAIPDHPPMPGWMDARTLASGHVVLTGTPLGGDDDPRHEYQYLYHHAAEVALRAPARARLAKHLPRTAAAEGRLAHFWRKLQEVFGDALQPVGDVAHAMGTDEPQAQVLRMQIEGGLRLVLTDDGEAVLLEVTAEAGEWRIEHAEDGRSLTTLTVDAVTHPANSAWIDPATALRLVVTDCRSGRRYELELPAQDTPQP